MSSKIRTYAEVQRMIRKPLYMSKIQSGSAPMENALRIW
jgi:hypothetical protein